MPNALDPALHTDTVSSTSISKLCALLSIKHVVKLKTVCFFPVKITTSHNCTPILVRRSESALVFDSFHPVSFPPGEILRKQSNRTNYSKQEKLTEFHTVLKREKTDNSRMNHIVLLVKILIGETVTGRRVSWR